MDNQKQGLSLNKDYIKSTVEQIETANRQVDGSLSRDPVHLEYKGAPMGRVVSTQEQKETLKCVQRLDKSVFQVEGPLAASLWASVSAISCCWATQ